MEQQLLVAERGQQRFSFIAVASLVAHRQREGRAVERTQWRRILFSLAILLWILALIPGVRSLMEYEQTPGTPAVPLQMWPAGVDLAEDKLEAAALSADADPRRGTDTLKAQLPVLVVALHPLCTCSRATLSELAIAAATFQHPYRAVLLVYQPRGSGASWQTTGLYQQAARVLHAQVVTDLDGAIAARFGAQTSGQVFLYSGAAKPAGRRLLFAGGVTAARGETGENQGLVSLEDAFQLAVAHQTGNGSARALTIAYRRSSVYGCGLFKLSRDARRSQQ